MGMIYHIAFEADWTQAQRDGEYRISTRGRTLEEEGFIHASRANQVAPVANMFYRDDQDLLVLAIDETLVTPEIRYDDVPGSNEPFPHVYGPLNVDAVVHVTALRRGPDGRFVFSGPHG